MKVLAVRNQWKSHWATVDQSAFAAQKKYFSLFIDGTVYSLQ